MARQAMPSPGPVRAPRSSSASRPRMATISSASGSSGGTSWSPATSSPSSSRAPRQMASSTSSRTAPWVMERWMRASRSSSSWRSWSESRSRWFSSDCISASRRWRRSSAASRNRRSDRLSTCAMPRARCTSSREKSPASRAKTSRDGVSGSTVIASAGRSGTPRATRRAVWPSAMSASAASTTGSRLKPTEATTSPALSSTARSAPSASAARSTATRLAVRSSSADETIARKPVSCWTDQLPDDPPGADRAGTSDEASCECTAIGGLGPLWIRARC